MSNRLMRQAARVGVVAIAAGAVALFGSGTASAHVTAKVLGEPAMQGGFTKITFRVPNEDDVAGTIKVEVMLPADTPITGARTKNQAGWTAKVTKVTLDKPIEVHGAQVKEAVSTVTWTANPGVRINPGEFAEFELSVGPLPETDQLVIPATQTYDNNDVVQWNEDPPAKGAEEPEHPAPFIALAPEGDGDHAAEPAAQNTGAESNDDGSDTAAATTDDTARWLGGAGLVVGALGLGFGVGATMRARRVVAANRGDQS